MLIIRKATSLVLTIFMAVTLIPAQTIAANEKTLAYGPLAASEAAQPADIVISSSPNRDNITSVSYEILTKGKAGETVDDTQSAVVRFTLNNPGEQTVSFDYEAVSGSANVSRHLPAPTSGTVSLSKDASQQDVAIEIAAFMDNTANVETPLPNPPDALWSGERIFYLYCDNIKNAMFDGKRESLTVPVPVESEFNYHVAYDNAINTSLIDLDEVPGGIEGVYPIPESDELCLTAEISGDVRKMIDAGVFTHINLLQGHFVNESEEEQDITYSIKAKNDILEPPTESSAAISESITLSGNNQTSFYSEDFSQSLPLGKVGLGPGPEANGLFNKLDFIFDYSEVPTTDSAISTCFFDEANQYLRHQVSFSDQAPPRVTGVSTDLYQAHYGDDIPVIIEFSEPVYTDGITFEVDGQSYSPMESNDTISQAVSFLYPLGDKALNSTSFTVDVTDITGAVDLSGKTQEPSNIESGSKDISFEPRLAFAYCAQPSIDLDQGIERNMSAAVTIGFKSDNELSNWLYEQIGEDNLSTAVKARAITSDAPDAVDIPLAVQIDETRVTGLVGTFEVPENDTGEDVDYLLEIYLDAGSGYEAVYSLAVIYTVPPLILVDDESDISLDYSSWPAGDKVFVDTAKSLYLDYELNVNATWQGAEYFEWSSSDESIAVIYENGTISLLGPGQVYFTLTVTNPLSDAAIVLTSPTLTVLESQEAYLYVPKGIENQELLMGSAAKISFSSNLAARNELYGDPGTETEYTFTLYEADYSRGTLETGGLLLSEVVSATAQSPLTSYIVPAKMLTKATARDRFGYILKISAIDNKSSETMTAQANIRIRQLPAKASLLRPESVFLTDNADSFIVGFDIENKTVETDYSLTVTRNSEEAPVELAEAPETIEPLTVSISDVEDNRLLDVYTVSLRAKNASDEAWSYDSYCVYVYNSSAMQILLNNFSGSFIFDSNFLTAPDTLTMGYDFEDGEVIYGRSHLNDRLDMTRYIKIDNKSYSWSAIADRVTWKVEGDGVSLWYRPAGLDVRRIGDDHNPLLLPGTYLWLKGEGSGSSVVTATHTLTGMSDSMNVTVHSLNDKLFLFRIYPSVSYKLVYTNGRGQEKTISDSRSEIGFFEESGIKGDVIVYPTGGAESVYDYCVIKNSSVMANQKSSNSFDQYPINNVRLPKINYNVTLELFDEETGQPYTGDIVIRAGVYHNGSYKNQTTVNGVMGNADQTVSANRKGQYSLAFAPSDFTNRLLASDELSYVIELAFADNSYRTKYIRVENHDIQKQKASPLGVCLMEGIKALNPDSIKNNAIILSQTLTIDGKKVSISDRLCLDKAPKKASLDMVVSIPQYSHNKYFLQMYDSTGLQLVDASVGEFIHAYPFSDTVTLHLTSDITNILTFHNRPWIKAGEILSYYPCIRSSDGALSIKLSDKLEVQNLQNVPKMDTLTSYVGGEAGDLRALRSSIWELAIAARDISFTEKNDAVVPSLDFLQNYSLDYDSIGMEVQSTDDPLVYKGIIRFAVGSYSKDNPSGLFVASGEKTSYQFMPEVSDMKAMAKGAFLEEAEEAMNEEGGVFKSYGGGAYIDCEIYYDIDEGKWKIRLLYGDLYLGGGGGFRKNFNTWVAFVPVTATFQYTMTSEAGLTILHSKEKNTTAYIPRLRPVFSIYGFGGVGFDYTFVAFKAGGYGFLEHEQLYRWYTDDKGLKMDGQQLKISGETGVEFAIWLAFVKLSGKYALAKHTDSWEYNDHNEISKKIAENAKERLKGLSMAPDGFSESASGMMMLVPLEESAVFEDRSYLKDYDRSWGSPSSGGRMLALFSAEELTDIWLNAYPNASPQLSDDGELMVYLSDMGSEDISKTAVLFAVKDESGSFSAEGVKIDPSELGYPDSNPLVSGTKEGASAAWIRTFTDIAGTAGSEATVEDAINNLAASEVMAGIYKDGAFTSTRLTDNDNPDLSPITASNGDKAITAWRSVTLADMENPLAFTSDYIMYSVYDGAAWSGARYLYDGSVNKVGAMKAAILPDGTSSIVYQIDESGGDSEIMCAVLDEKGELVRSLRLTENMTEDLNPQISVVQFPDGVKKFVIGWSTQTEDGESKLQMVAVNSDGTLYPEFSLELSDSSGTTDYSSFMFTRGAQSLEDLSVILSKPGDDDKDGIYEYSVYGTKLLVSTAGTVSASGNHKLLELSEGRTLYSLDSTADPDTGKVQFMMLLAEPDGSSTITSALAEYRNHLTVKEPYYEYEDILPGLEMPVLFTVKNDGVDTITSISITLGGQTVEYDETLAPDEERKYLIYHTVPDDPVAHAEYTVTAQFGEAETDTRTGTLLLGLPDVGIYQIDRTSETGRERGFRVLLQNPAFGALKEGTHAVKLEVWNRPDFEAGSPLKTITVSDDNLSVLNDSLLSLDITLSEADLQRFLDESGEIPEGGATVFFRTVLTEGGKTIEDADISNDIDYMNIYSLIEKNGGQVSLASLSQTTDGKTKVEVEATNNSMKTINKGNIIVTLRDREDNVLETQQTHNAADSTSLLNIPGEESKTASLLFNGAGYKADVTFAEVSEESALLSVLNLTGVFMEFNPDVFIYDAQTYDLSKTNLTVVAQNPESTVSVTKDGVAVSISSPISMTYGKNTFVITVTTGETDKTYTVTVTNSKSKSEDGKDKGSDSGTAYSGSYTAMFTIDGIKQGDISVSLRGGHAIISLASLAQEFFSGDKEASLDIPAISGAQGYTLEIPADGLAGPYTQAALIASTELGSIRIPAGMLAGISDIEGKLAGITIEAANKSKLTEEIRQAIGDRPMLALTLTLDGKQVDWNNPDAPVTVRIPYTPTEQEHENPESIVIWYLDGSGNAVSVPNGHYDPVTGTVTFSTTHFSDFAVVYNHVAFNDVASTAWYYKPVSFIAARGITQGTGKGEYSPEAVLTRAECIVLLMRACGISPDENPSDNFADAGNSYYTGYLAAAKRLGISKGVENNIGSIGEQHPEDATSLFAPDRAITRQEMVTLMYNALEAIKRLPQVSNSDDAGQGNALSDFSGRGDALSDSVGQGRTLTDFSDEGQIADWARDAMALLVEAGIINGDGGKLSPKGMTKRAQMAQVLYNLMMKKINNK